LSAIGARSESKRSRFRPEPSPVRRLASRRKRLHQVAGAEQGSVEDALQFLLMRHVNASGESFRYEGWDGFTNREITDFVRRFGHNPS